MGSEAFIIQQATVDKVTGIPSTWVLTGAIGTGKSTVGSLFASHGARVIDADRTGHAAIAPDGSAFEAVATIWPEVVVDGRIDRRALGRIVFADPDQLARLESVTHPAILDLLDELVRTSTSAVTVVEVSVPHLAIDPSWRRIVVVASLDVRRQRLADRGMTLDEIDGRMASQPPEETWVRTGDVVVNNSGSLEQLRERVAQVWEQLSNK